MPIANSIAMDHGAMEGNGASAWSCRHNDIATSDVDDDGLTAFIIRVSCFGIVSGFIVGVTRGRSYTPSRLLVLRIGVSSLRQ